MRFSLLLLKLPPSSKHLMTDIPLCCRHPCDPSLSLPTPGCVCPYSAFISKMKKQPPLGREGLWMRWERHDLGAGEGWGPGTQRWDSEACSQSDSQPIQGETAARLLELKLVTRIDKCLLQGKTLRSLGAGRMSRRLGSPIRQWYIFISPPLWAITRGPVLGWCFLGASPFVHSGGLRHTWPSRLELGGALRLPWPRATLPGSAQAQPSITSHLRLTFPSPQLRGLGPSGRGWNQESLLAKAWGGWIETWEKRQPAAAGGELAGSNQSGTIA